MKESEIADLFDRLMISNGLCYRGKQEFLAGYQHGINSVQITVGRTDKKPRRYLVRSYSPHTIKM